MVAVARGRHVIFGTGPVGAALARVQHELHAHDRPFLLDHSWFSSAFGEQVTGHPEAVRATLMWFTAKPRPVEVSLVDRVIDQVRPLAKASRLARRPGSGALALAKS